MLDLIYYVTTASNQIDFDLQKVDEVGGNLTSGVGKQTWR